MTQPRVLVMGEGPHELGPVPPDADRKAWALEQGRLPALPLLVSRLLQRSAGVAYFARQTGRKKQHVHRNLRKRTPPALSGRAKRVLWAIRAASRDEFDALAYVVDRDRADGEASVADLNEGREAAGAGAAVPCALGVAVETFDAWMICDAEAIDKAGGKPGKAHANPESLDRKEGSGNHPKDVADAIFDTRRGTGLGPNYAAVAEHVDLPGLERACPQGFGPFAEEVRERIGPAAGPR